MTTYNKTLWVDNKAPALNSKNLNKIETGISDAHDELLSHEIDENNPHNVTAEQVQAEPLGAVSEYALSTNIFTNDEKAKLSSLTDNTPVSKTVTADIVAIKNDLILADASSNPIIVSFNAPQTDDQIIVTKTDSSANTVTCPGNIVLNYQNSSANLLFDGSVWRII